MKPKVLLTQWVPEICNDRFKDKLELIYPNKDKKVFSYDEILEKVVDVDGFFVISSKADKRIIDAGKNLKVIGVLGVGYDSVDVEYATSKNIGVINAPNSVTEATAELTIGLIISSMRNIVGYDKTMREGKWVASAFSDSSTEVFGQTLGIIGLGRIGKSVCKKAQAMGMTVLYYKPTRLSIEEEKELNVEYKDMDSIFKESNCVTLHMPYTKDSHHLVDEKRLSQMKKGSFLINVARGAIVKESALVEALNNGTLKGAALDVYEFEPKVSKELLACENVVMTPHVGTQTLQVRVNMFNESMTGVESFLQGEKPSNLVNKV